MSHFFDFCINIHFGPHLRPNLNINKHSRDFFHGFSYDFYGNEDSFLSKHDLRITKTFLGEKLPKSSDNVATNKCKIISHNLVSG